MRRKQLDHRSALIGTVVEVTPPACVTYEVGVVVAWDHPDYGECRYSHQPMVVLLPEDYGAGE